MQNKWTRRMVIGALFGGGLGAGGYGFCHSARFGNLPEGEDLARISQSVHCVDGVFYNTQVTPLMVGKQSIVRGWMDFFFNDQPRLRPEVPLPTMKISLLNIDRTRDCVVWFGHSSFYLQLAGKRILLDPVLSSYAAPVPFVVRSFAGTDSYSPSDMPDIDLLLLSHDHWDHLDYPTLVALEPRIKAVVCGLGVGSHLKRFGFAKEKIYEGDWGDRLIFEAIQVIVTESRHFSGRLFTRDHTLWNGFVIQTEQRRVYFSGDGGYGAHFVRIGNEYGPMDLALLDMGQYNDRWPYVHMNPEEAAKAAADVGAGALMPTHVGRFCISRHPWDEPFIRIAKAATRYQWKLLTPIIGQSVFLDEDMRFTAWWKNMV